MENQTWLSEKVFDWIDDSPTYHDLKTWLEKYPTIRFCYKKPNEEYVYHLVSKSVVEIRNSLRHYRDAIYNNYVFFDREISSTEIKEIEKELEVLDRNGTMDLILKLKFSDLIVDLTFLYLDKKNRTSSIPFADFLIDSQNLRYLLSLYRGVPRSAWGDSKGYTEADFWSDVYEHQKEYNENH